MISNLNYAPPKTSSNAPINAANSKVDPRQIIKNENDFKK